MFDQILKQLDLPPYRLKQINHAIFKELIGDWSQATALPGDLREYLQENVPLSTIEPARVLTSDKGDTIKVAFRALKTNGIPDSRSAALPVGDDTGCQFESVLMMHDDRNTVCVSSQIGCPVGCTFCATGQMGFKRNLNYREIVDQVLWFARYLKYGVNAHTPEKSIDRKINNIVFMGMGEPMLNIDNVSQSIDILTDDNLFGLGKRKITVSTSGYIEPLRKFLNNYPHIGLAISLHAPNQQLREKIMPTVAKSNHIDDLIAVAREYSQRTKRRVSFEYILIDGVNDDLEHARELAHIVGARCCVPCGLPCGGSNCVPRVGSNCATDVKLNNCVDCKQEGTQQRAPTDTFLFHINLIPYNPIENFKLHRPNTYRVNRFKNELIKLGIPVSVRVSMGDDIAAACGQLAGE
ncbi:MAG: 23S rRNA (adenine(2503)-C(2))-methyltransferase RlmN [Patescibacteria group bacterium]